VEVRDRGPGVRAGEEELVFERFHRGAGAGSAPGTGLGLAIARSLAHGWGGDATLRARPGGGAIAALIVPRERSSEEMSA
jgi:signal transduction histidine kinase